MLHLLLVFLLLLYTFSAKRQASAAMETWAYSDSYAKNRKLTRQCSRGRLLPRSCPSWRGGPRAADRPPSPARTHITSDRTTLDILTPLAVLLTQKFKGRSEGLLACAIICIVKVSWERKG